MKLEQDASKAIRPLADMPCPRSIMLRRQWLKATRSFDGQTAGQRELRIRGMYVFVEHSSTW